jgi:Fe-S-cluster-containing dehydrogenase component
MSNPGMTGPDDQARGGATISRRRVLQAGLAAVPALCGASLVSAALGVPGGDARAADPTPGASAAPVASAGPTGTAPAYDPTAHDWAFVVDTTTCIGCGRCVEACKLENNVPDSPELNRTWVELHVLGTDGTMTVTSPDGGRHGFPANDVPDPSAVRDAYFVPRLCMQCENPPCTWVCPVSATFRNADGVVLVDENRCIGCGYCIVACPYGARYMVPDGERTPKGVGGVVDKCTFCYHRITKGLEPACAEVCPVNARIFGDRRDPKSDVSVAITARRVRAMKPSLGTRPRVYYTGLEGEVE